MIELNDNNFSQELQNRKMMLVDFYANWCGPCNMQSKVLDRIYNSRALNLDIAKVNVDEAPKLAMKYEIKSIPTLVLFKDNKPVKKVVGYTEEQEILTMVEQYQD